MKVTREKVVPAFEPITIVIESQEEIDLIVALLGKLSNRIASTILNKDYQSGPMYSALHPYSSIGLEQCASKVLLATRGTE